MSWQLCLILGGVRSGKSAFAEQLAAELNQLTLYVATGSPTDADMAERIRRHRESRPADWNILEEPVDLPGRLEGALGSTASPGAILPGVLLIDSLDLWVSNMLLEHEGEASETVEQLVLSQVDRLLELVCRSSASFFIVSSEVGLAPVPPFPLGRRFQDLLGLANQRMAAAAQRVYLVVAGIPVEIKGLADS
jgi:adenosylcobinamide kinase/adenosylcobinamide-phosphate guanylyltransferase